MPESQFRFVNTYVELLLCNLFSILPILIYMLFYYLLLKALLIPLLNTITSSDWLAITGLPYLW